jgi:hypothetical protein
MRHAEDVNQYFHHIAWCPRQFGTMQDWHVDSTDMFLYIDRSIIYTLFHSLPAQSLRSSITFKPPIVLHRDFGNVLKCSVHWKQPLQIQLLCFASQILFPASAQDLRVISQQLALGSSSSPQNPSTQALSRHFPSPLIFPPKEVLSFSAPLSQRRLRSISSISVLMLAGRRRKRRLRNPMSTEYCRSSVFQRITDR